MNKLTEAQREVLQALADGSDFHASQTVMRSLHAMGLVGLPMFGYEITAAGREALGQHEPTKSETWN